MAPAQARVTPPDAKAGITESRRLAFNFGVLALGEFLAKLLTFAAFSYFARNVGAQAYGAVEFTIAVMVFFTLPADLGLGAYGAREIARDRGRASTLLREITGMRILLAACSFLMLVIFAVSIDRGPEVRQLLLVYGLGLFGGPALLQWFFQAHDLMHWVAAASIVRQLTFAGLMFSFFTSERPLVFMAVFECVSIAVAALFCFVVVHWRMRVPFYLPSFHLEGLRAHIRQAVPIGLTELAWAFMWYFATVLLGFVFADQELGWFGASHRVTMALHTFVWLYFFNLLPSISRCVDLPTKHLTALMNRSMRLAAWTGMFAALSLTMMSKEVLTILYGPYFRGAATSFNILVWMLPVAILSGHYRYALIAYGLQNQLLLCTTIAAGAAVLLGFALVPLFGATGAASALLIANIINFALVYYHVRARIIRIRFRRQLWHPILAMGAALVLFYSMRNINAWFAYACAAAAFGTVLVTFQARHVAALIRIIIERRSTRGISESWAR